MATKAFGIGLLALTLALCAGAEPANTFAASAYGGSLKAALTAIGTAPATLLVDATLACDAPAIPAHVEVVVPRGGCLDLGTATLKVAGTLAAGRYAIFSATRRRYSAPSTPSATTAPAGSSCWAGDIP